MARKETNMNAEALANTTRQKILTVAAEEIHLHGFQACSLSAVIKKAGVSKGAVYHHFNNKLELGYAVFDEVLTPHLIAMWEPMLLGENPTQAMIQHFQMMLENADCEMLAKGCPLNNLAHEMSAVDEGFRLRINQIINQSQAIFTEALLKAQTMGQLDQNIDCKRTATFLVSAVQGALGIAKNTQDKAVLEQCILGLIDYLKQLEINHEASKI
ncbi:MAG: TetR/AcrR family transcriptional regulator [Ghiorsea sp.]